MNASYTLRNAKLALNKGPCSDRSFLVVGIRLISKKIQQILEIMNPLNVEIVLSLMGMTTYHNRFIPNLARASKPITSLTVKDVKFYRSLECAKALDYVKERLASDPIVLSLG